MIHDPELETLDRAQLRELQGRRLRAVVRYACERIGLYRERFEDAGVDPGEIRSLDDLRRLPFTRKSDLRDELSVRDVRGAARGRRAHPRLVRDDREADGRRLHAGRRRAVRRGQRALPRDGRRGARDDAAQRASATGCSPAGSACTTAASASG